MAPGISMEAANASKPNNKRKLGTGYGVELVSMIGIFDRLRQQQLSDRLDARSIFVALVNGRHMGTVL